MVTRKFYHPGREPEAHFMANGKFYCAMLQSFWDDGVRLALDQAPQLEVGLQLTAIYFSKYHRQYHAPDLQVSRIIDQPPHFHLEARLCNPAEAWKLARAITRIENPLPPMDQPSVDTAALPVFSRKKHYSPAAIDKRVDWVEQVSGVKLHHLIRNGLRPESLAGNIENYIGAIQVPLGIAGPVMVRGLYAQGYIPVPIATTEGALISSITRGAQTCNQADGIQVHICRQTMLRAPVFFCRDMDGAINLEHWIYENLETIRNKAESVSSVASLDNIRSHVFDNSLHLRFYYTTGDASGQNMTTACTWMACRWIRKQVRHDPAIGLESFIIEGNLSGDKKANYQNYTLGRGIAVTATCRIPGALLKQRLRVTPAQYMQGWQAGEVGALHSGMVGSNINFANVVAGLFTATGQDIACVHESASGYFRMRQAGDDLVVAAYLPALVVGTVGGGTKLPTQRECLELMGCYGNGKVFRLAEIIGATCLALDLSTGAAIVANEFVHAHEHFGRNRPPEHLSFAQIDTGFFNTLLADDNLVVESVTRGDLDTRDAILSRVTRKGGNSVRGLFRYHLRVRDALRVREINTVLKIKPPGRELVDIGVQVAGLTGEDTLSGLFESQSHIFNLERGNVREIAFYRHAGPLLPACLPRIYGTRCDDRSRIYAILMEDLTGCSHLSTIDDPGCWQPHHIESVLTCLADLHAVFWQRRHDVPAAIPLADLDVETTLASADLLEALTDFNAFRYPDLIKPDFHDLLENALTDLRAIISAMQQLPMTLTHNDFTPRNICLREADGVLQPVIYDWELALFQNPQHDVIEFLLHALDGNAPLAAFDHYIDHYYQQLAARIDGAPSVAEFKQGLGLNAVELALVRFNLYLMGHNLLNFGFIDRVYRNLTRYIEHTWRPGD